MNPPVRWSVPPRRAESITSIHSIILCMGATTVRISTSTNRKLDTLQARLRVRSGRRVTKQTILEKLIDQALEGEDPILLLAPPEYPLPKRTLRMLRDFPEDWGVKTTETDIDAILYGGQD